MQTNRSVPADILISHIVYNNVAEAIVWLTRVFGFSEHFRYGDPANPNGAQMLFGQACFMLRETRPGSATPKDLGAATQSLTVFVPDVDAHHARAKSAGAKIVEEPHETEYGEYQYGVEDFAGHHWLFARHARDASPESWGATLARR
jgi:uncharacterized glyoxalase superfamily protein PhnB